MRSDNFSLIFVSPPSCVKVKSATVNEIARENLFSEHSEVRYILTHNALKEGWDCSFAYLATSIEYGSPTALTQLVGRVLRQPHANRTGVDDLDSAYVVCSNQKRHESVHRVKEGLAREGLADVAALAVRPGRDAIVTRITVPRRPALRGLAIFLPKVLHQVGDSWDEIDYERDLLAGLNWAALTIDGVMALDTEDHDLIRRVA